MKKTELMEVSNETLALWAAWIQDELARRGVGATAVALNTGNAQNGKPLPHVVRVLQKMSSLPPGDLQKLEVLVDAWVAARTLR